MSEKAERKMAHPKILTVFSFFHDTEKRKHKRLFNFTMNNTTQQIRRSRGNLASSTFQSHSICLTMVLLMLSASTSAFSEVGRRSNVPYNSALRTTATMAYTNAGSRGSRREGQVPQVPFTTTTTRLQFRDGDHGDTATRVQEHDAASSPEAQGRWWQMVFATPDPALSADVVDSEQEVVDEYLEFLNRRYQRLHVSERKEAKFSAWKWLMQEDEASEDQSVTTKEEKEDNAFYVLGVAGLASQRLLQKHQPATPTQASAATRKVESHGFAVDAVMTVLPSSRLSVVASMAVAGVTPILERLLRQRRALLRFQTVTLRTALKFLIRKGANAPIRAAKSVIRLGGGKQNIVVTATVTAALAFVLVRPVVQALMMSDPQ
jgi:hypothetical protein